MRNLLALVEEMAQFDSVGVTMMAKRLHIPVANAYRLLRVLENLDYAEQLPDKNYRLTLKLFEVGCRAANRVTIRDLAAVEMERLAQQCGLAVNLASLVGSEVLYLEKVQTDDVLVLNLPPGSRAPATCTALGKAMLAFDPRGARSIVGPGPYATRTPESVSSLDELELELAEVRRVGFAVDRQQLAPGIWCVGAPICNAREDVLGAISVTAFSSSMEDDELVRLGSLVVMAARRIGARARNFGSPQRVGDDA